MRRALGRLRRPDDRGEVIPIVALMLFSLLAITAIVVDLGYARATKRENQADVDLAAVAAGYNLAGGGSSGYAVDPAAACASALTSLRANISDLPASLTMSPPCSSLPPSISACSPTYPMKTMTSRNGDPYEVTIEWPVDDAAIARDEFNGTDGRTAQSGVGAADGDRCERMRVSITRDNAPIFEGVLGGDGQTVGASATVRASNSGDNLAIPALLLLERKACATLQVSGNGGVAVRSSGDVYGVIHSDTAGTVPPCTTNTNAGGFAVYGTERPSSTGGGPSIIAEGTATRPGKISIYALSPGVNGRGGSYYCAGPCPTSGLSVAPTPGKIISRKIVDNVYNSPENPYIQNTHEGGYRLATSAERVSTDPATLDAYLTSAYGGSAHCFVADAACWVVISGADCSAGDRVYQGRGMGVGVQADNYFVLCDDFDANRVVFRNGLGVNPSTGTVQRALPGGLPYGKVVFSGKVSPSGANSCTTILTTYARCTNYLAFPNADIIYVRGCVKQCNGAGDYAIRSRSLIATNHGEGLSLAGLGPVVDSASLDLGVPPAQWPWLNCTVHRNGPGDGGLWNQWTKIATFNRKVTVENGTLSWCQTFLYPGKDTASYSPNTTTTGFNCSDIKPCPTDNGTQGLVQINSGSALPVAWQGPNQTSEGPGTTSPFEDLALWTEGGGSAGECVIAGTGAMQAGGIFFHPNCAMTYGGQTDNQNPLNAQFIGRSLNVSGQGVLSLRPNAKDAIAVQVGGDVVLIR